MRKYLFIALLSIVGLFISCDNSVDGFQQAFPADSVQFVGVSSPAQTRAPVEGVTLSAIQGHEFKGINGDDFYIIGATNNSRRQSAVIEYIEFDSQGFSINGGRIDVPPKRSVRRKIDTNKQVYSVRVTCTSGSDVYVSLGSANKHH